MPILCVCEKPEHKSETFKILIPSYLIDSSQIFQGQKSMVEGVSRSS